MGLRVLGLQVGHEGRGTQLELLRIVKFPVYEIDFRHQAHVDPPAAGGPGQALGEDVVLPGLRIEPELVLTDAVVDPPDHVASDGLLDAGLLDVGEDAGVLGGTELVEDALGLYELVGGDVDERLEDLHVYHRLARLDLAVVPAASYSEVAAVEELVPLAPGGRFVETGVPRAPRIRRTGVI